MSRAPDDTIVDLRVGHDKLVPDLTAAERKVVGAVNKMNRLAVNVPINVGQAATGGASMFHGAGQGATSPFTGWTFGPKSAPLPVGASMPGQMATPGLTPPAGHQWALPGSRASNRAQAAYARAAAWNPAGTAPPSPPPPPGGTTPGAVAAGGGLPRRPGPFTDNDIAAAILEARIQAAADKAYKAARGGAGGIGRGGGGSSGVGSANRSGRITGGIDFLDRLGTTQGPDAIMERFRRFIPYAGIAFGVAKATEFGLDTYGQARALGRARDRGDINSEVELLEKSRERYSGIPIVGGLAGSIRRNVLDELGISSIPEMLSGSKFRSGSTTGSIEQLEWDAKKQDQKTERTAARAARLASTREGFRGMAAGLTAGSFDNEADSQQFALAQQRRALAEMIRKNPDPGKDPFIDAQIKQARDALHRIWLNVQVEAERLSEDQRSQAREVSARLVGDSDSAAAEQFGRGLEGERRAAYAQSRDAGLFFDTNIRGARQEEFNRGISRQRSGEARDSSLTFQDSMNAVVDADLRNRGQSYEADLRAYSQSWDRKLAKAREAVAQETDQIRKGHRERELAGLEEERRAAESRERMIRQRERNMDIGRVRTGAEADRLRAAGRFDEARRLERNAARRDRLGAAADDAEMQGEIAGANDAEAASERADRDRELRRMTGENRETELRLEGRDTLADAMRAKREMDEELQAAAGDIEKQQAIRARYALQLEGIRRDAASPRFAEVLRGFGTRDLQNRNTGNRRDQQAIEGLLKEIRDALKNNRNPPALTT